MTTAQKAREINSIRKELAMSGACPFEVAANALARNTELRRHIERLEQMLQS